MSEIHTILIVEDNATDVMLIRRAFMKLSIANPVQIVADGDRAVAYLSGHDGYEDRQQFPMPAIVLLDLKLPRRSGLEVLEWLRGQNGLRRLPVVVLTSSRQSQDVNRAYDLGANSYLVKPVEFADLQEMLSTVNTYWIHYNQRPHISPTA